MKELAKNINAQERVAVFFDQDNIFQSLRKYTVKTALGTYKFTLDHKKFLDFITKHKRLVSAYMYDGIKFLDEPIVISQKKFFFRPEKIKFFNAMRSIGFHLRVGFVKKNSNGNEKQWGVDSKMIRDIIKLAKQDVYDTAIVVSGDHHLIHAIRTIMELNKKVVIYGFKKTIHRKLVQLVGMENIHYIEDLLPLINNITENQSDLETDKVNYKMLAKFLLIKEKLQKRKLKREQSQ